MAVGKFNRDPNYDDDINFIRDTERVQGDPAGTDPDITPLTGTANKVFQKIVNSLAYLKNAIDNFSVARMTDSVFGTGRTATQNEAEGGSAHGQGGPLLTPQRGMQLLRSPSAKASTTRLGSVERLTQTEARNLTDTERYLTVALLAYIIENAPGLRASSSQHGVVQTATESDVANEENTGRVTTIGSLYRNVDLDILEQNDLSNINDPVPITITLNHVRDKYFGPIKYEAEIQITVRVPVNNSAGFLTGVRFNNAINATEYIWTSTTTNISGASVGVNNIAVDTNSVGLTCYQSAAGTNDIVLTGKIIP